MSREPQSQQILIPINSSVSSNDDVGDINDFLQQEGCLEVDQLVPKTEVVSGGERGKAEIYMEAKERAKGDQVLETAISEATGVESSSTSKTGRVIEESEKPQEESVLFHKSRLGRTYIDAPVCQSAPAEQGASIAKEVGRDGSFIQIESGLTNDCHFEREAHQESVDSLAPEVDRSAHVAAREEITAAESSSRRKMRSAAENDEQPQNKSIMIHMMRNLERDHSEKMDEVVPAEFREGVAAGSDMWKVDVYQGEPGITSDCCLEREVDQDKVVSFQPEIQASQKEESSAVETSSTSYRDGMVEEKVQAEEESALLCKKKSHHEKAHGNGDMSQCHGESDNIPEVVNSDSAGIILETAQPEEESAVFHKRSTKGINHESAYDDEKMDHAEGGLAMEGTADSTINYDQEMREKAIGLMFNNSPQSDNIEEDVIESGTGAREIEACCVSVSGGEQRMIDNAQRTQEPPLPCGTSDQGPVEATSTHKLPKLHRLLRNAVRQNDDYNRVPRRIKKCRGFLAKGSHQEVLEIKFMDENVGLPLHIALQSHTRAPYDIVESLVKAYKDGVRVRSVSGDLALHMACYPMSTGFKTEEGEDTTESRNKELDARVADVAHSEYSEHKAGADNEISQPHPPLEQSRKWERISITSGSEFDRTIRLVMEAFPQAIRERGAEGGTPFHTVLEHKPNLDLVNRMVELSGEIEQNESGLSAGTSLLQIKDCESQLPLHVAIQYRADPCVIERLIELFPEAAKVPMEKGFIPLHLAAHWGCSRGVLDRLLEKNVGGILKRTWKAQGWDTPLHIIFSTEHNLERWCAGSDHNHDSSINKVHSDLHPEHMVRLMISAYYASLRCPTKAKPFTPKQAEQKLKILLKSTRNAFGINILQQARNCRELLGDNVDHRLEELLEYMEGIIDGTVEAGGIQRGKKENTASGKSQTVTEVAFCGAAFDTKTKSKSGQQGLERKEGFQCDLDWGEEADNDNAQRKEYEGSGDTVELKRQQKRRKFYADTDMNDNVQSGKQNQK